MNKKYWVVIWTPIRIDNVQRPMSRRKCQFQYNHWIQAFLAVPGFLWGEDWSLWTYQSIRNLLGLNFSLCSELSWVYSSSWDFIKAQEALNFRPKFRTLRCKSLTLGGHSSSPSKWKVNKFPILDGDPDNKYKFTLARLSTQSVSLCVNFIA